MGSYRPDSKARRDKTAEELAELEEKRRLEEEERKTAEEYEEKFDAWDTAAQGLYIRYFNRSVPRYKDFQEAWINSGLDPNDGVAWMRMFGSEPYKMNIVEKDIKTALRNKEAGITPDFAEPFVRHQKRVSTKQLKMFKKLIDDGKLADRDAAVSWFRNGIKADETADWLQFTNDWTAAVRWQNAGFDREECLNWYKASEDEPRLAEQAKRNDMSPEELEGWVKALGVRNIGLDTLYTIQLTEMKLDELKDWEAQGFNPREDNSRHEFYGMDEILKYKQLGLSAEEGGKLLKRRQELDKDYRRLHNSRHGGYPHISQALEWQEAGLSQYRAAEFFSHGFKPEEAVLWDKRGVSAEHAVIYRELGYSPEDETIPEYTEDKYR